MAVNKSPLDSESLENLRKLAEFTTIPSRTELSDRLPRHLSDSKISDLQKEYASHHRRKNQGSAASRGKWSDDVHFAEKFENESSEKGIADDSLQDIDISASPSNSNISSSTSRATPSPAQNKCESDGTTHCTEPRATMGHHLLASIRTVWTKMWLASCDDVLASG